jgi:predicted small metal-binding protein
MLCIVVNCVFMAMADPTTDVVPGYEVVVRHSI